METKGLLSQGSTLDLSFVSYVVCQPAMFSNILSCYCHPAFIVVVTDKLFPKRKVPL